MAHENPIGAGRFAGTAMHERRERMNDARSGTACRGTNRLDRPNFDTRNARILGLHGVRVRDRTPLEWQRRKPEQVDDRRAKEPQIVCRQIL